MRGGARCYIANPAARDSASSLSAFNIGGNNFFKLRDLDYLEKKSLYEKNIVKVRQNKIAALSIQREKKSPCIH
jgi:hypothetical protein